ncbi:MAG: hypothetical protein LBU23_07175 [Planctomycetota bacterium]|jgi:hypothetical protein|nr:hypothetical protein [Planctomycetota bacterium]
MERALAARLDDLEEPLPAGLLERRRFPGVREAIRCLHSPPHPATRLWICPGAVSASGGANSLSAATVFLTNF